MKINIPLYSVVDLFFIFLVILFMKKDSIILKVNHIFFD